MTYRPLSSAFPPRNTTRPGEAGCPICQRGFARNVGLAAFLKAHAPHDGAGRPDRLLTDEEYREYQTEFKRAQRLARERGILPRRDRRGRVARRQRPASLEEAGIRLGWLFDHMVHMDCVPGWVREGRQAPLEIVARPGHRTVGVAHNIALGESIESPAPAVEPEAPAPAELADAVAEINAASADLARQANTPRQPLPAWAQHMARDPEAVAERAASQRERNAQRARLIAERNRGPAPTQLEPDEERAVRRFAALDLEDEPPAPAPTGEEDGGLGAARFALLDLD